MNAMRKVISAGCALLLLAGCKDASVTLPGSSEVIATVGNQSVTKGDLYDVLFASIGSDTAASDALNAISAQEIEVTDEMKESAQGTLDMYNLLYGDSFSEYLSASGMSDEDYINDYLIPSLQSEELVTKYMEEHFTAIAEEYNPIQAIVLTFTSQEDASAALSALKDGSLTPAQAASENNSSSSGSEEIITINTTSYDSAALSVIRSASSDDGWTEVTSTDGATWYLVNVVSNDPNEFKDDAIAALSNITKITNASTDYYFRKYGFHVYDINLYNALKDSNPEMLVQDSAAEEVFAAD
ncbi:MAG: hypothetical protein IJ225_07190 [Solobacterium sp.]|nr:hypothetical protein [Solobacterium sp.]